jgi:broad specificity phosphatase PhoE
MLYIRHAQKAYRNGDAKEFALDPELTEKGREAARNKFRELIRVHGIPSRIISSPYLRARETAQIACEVIAEVNDCSIQITCDSSIGEYLGHHRGIDLSRCLRPETLSYNPIPPEQWKQYSTRVKRHVHFTRECRVSQSSQPIWYITHGIVIKSVAFFQGYDIAYPCELSGIKVDPDKVSLI